MPNIMFMDLAKKKLFLEKGPMKNIVITPVRIRTPIVSLTDTPFLMGSLIS